MLNLSGYISASAKFVPGYGIVKLDQPYQGLRFASITTGTKGRENLTKDKDGRLTIGCRVCVEHAIVMSEALLITQITRE